MKLIELFDPKITSVNNKLSNINKLKDKIRKDKISGGHFSTVYDNKDAHLVTKMSNDAEKGSKDKYWDYINELISDGIWKSNPHFPRIYSIKKHNLHGKTFYRGTMERLIDEEDIDSQLIKSYIIQNFDLDLKVFEDRHDLLSAVCTCIEEGTLIINEKIKEASDWLINFSRHMGWVFDLHTGNIMFRRISTGIQLVITDPF